MLRVGEALLTAGLRVAGFRSRYVPTAAGPVHALVRPGRGDLPPLLMIHGLSACSADFAPMFGFLREHRRIIAIDLFGHGASAPLPELPSADVHALLHGAVDALIDDEPAVVFGNSLGGLMAVRYALARPERVKRLILASPGGARMDPAELSGLMSGFRMETVKDARNFMDKVLARRGWRSWALAFGTRARFARAGVRSLLDRADPADLLSPEELGALAMPTLVLWGAADRVLPDSCRLFFKDNLPGHALFEEPEGYGHAPFLDDPRGLAGRIRRFAA